MTGWAIAGQGSPSADQGRKVGLTRIEGRLRGAAQAIAAANRTTNRVRSHLAEIESDDQPPDQYRSG